MESVNIPLVPQWNLISGCCSTPDDGFLYIGNKTINYISKIQENSAPLLKVFHTRQRIKCLDCDTDWSETKYFAALADDNSVQIWDYEDGKAKRGHRAHIKPVFGDGDGPPTEMVKLCFLKNRSVLSVDSLSLVQYCISSNTYSKGKRIIPSKHDVSIIKGSPYDERIFAVGTIRGLILIIDLKGENVLFTLRGHDAGITSLSWMKVETDSATKIKPILKIKQKTVTDDDIFDIYDYDYLENEFGAPARPKLQKSDDDGVVESSEKIHDSVDNANFNFVEECQSLKSDMLASQNFETSIGASGSAKQVTLKDCQQSEVYVSTSSFSNQSNQSLDIGDRSTTESCKEGDYSPEPTQHLVDVHNAPGTPEEKCTSIVYLASGSHEPVVWIWNTQSGASVDKLQLKNSSQHIIIEVCWINESTILTNSRAGELMLWKAQIGKNNKLSFKHENRAFSHRGVASVCKLQSCDIIWTISSYREVTCEDISLSRVLAKYSCASSNISQIRERPDDMNRIAFGCADRRIGVMNLSNISHNNVKIENFSNKIDSSVLALAWCPEDSRLAFATTEGRVGVLDTEKANAVPIIMNPFCGKSIYSISCTAKHVIACGGDKVAFYDLNGKSKDPYIIPNINNASSISIKGNYLLVGTQIGNIELYKRQDSSSLNFTLISSQNIGPKYISEISWCILVPTRCAISSLSNKIVILNLTSQGILDLERNLSHRDMNSGNTCVKWSNQSEHLLLSCGFDGAVRIWDLSKTDNELIFLKQFICPMLCGLFSPLNENVIICAGKATSIEMFNMKKEMDSEYSKEMWRKNKDKPLEGVQWATKIKSSLFGLSRERKRNRKRGRGNCQNNPLDDSEIEALRTMMASDWGPTAEAFESERSKDFLGTEGTILHLAAKETNRDVLQTIVNFLEVDSDSKEENSKEIPEKGEHKPTKEYKKLLSAKLFGNKQEVQEVLNTELRNHQTSRTKSVAHLLIPQLNCNVKEEILTCLQNKKLTEWHLSLAPSVSYEFWKKCSLAYASQLLEVGHVIQAIPHLLACHDIKAAINSLLEKNHFREAWVIAKIHREADDPILSTILGKWIDFLETSGNLEGATLLCILSERYSQAGSIIDKRKNKTAEHLKVIDLLAKKVSLL